MPHPPPPPRTDLPCPQHLTQEGYASYLTYLAGASPDSWRETDGTIYLTWVPHDLLPAVAKVGDLSVVPPGDPQYGRFLDDLLPYFDYAGLEIPHATSADHDSEAW
jgi:hypothetical protein